MIMTEATHPLVKWFREQSGWAVDGQQLPESASSEGKLVIDVWNAAIESALSHVYADGNPMVAREKIQQLHYTVANQ